MASLTCLAITDDHQPGLLSGNFLLSRRPALFLPVGAVLKLELENRNCQTSGSPERESHTRVPLVGAGQRANPDRQKGRRNRLHLLMRGWKVTLPSARRQGWEEQLWPDCVCLAIQSRPTHCNPMGCSPPGPSVHGDSPGRNTEWVAMPFSRGSSLPRDQTWVSCIAGRFFTI